MVCVGSRVGLVWVKAAVIDWECLLQAWIWLVGMRVPCPASLALKFPLRRDRIRKVISLVASKGTTATGS